MQPHSSAAIPQLEPALAEAGIAPGVLAAWAVMAIAVAGLSALAFQGSVVGGIVVALIAGAFTLRALVMFRRRVRATSDALVVRGLFGERQLRYRDVERVQFDVAAQQTGLDFNRSMSFRGDKTSVSMRWLKPGPATAIGRHVADIVVPRLIESVSRDLIAGKTLKVGKAELSRTGLKLKIKEIGWHEIDRIDRSPVGLRVFPVDRPGDVITIAITAAQAPLLFGLVDAMTERTRAGVRRPVDVEGFAARDAKLGQLVCGRPRRRQREKVASGVALVSASATAAVVGLALFNGDVDLAGAIGIGGGVVAAVSGLVWISARKYGVAVYDNGITDGRQSIVFADATGFRRTLVDQYVNGAYSGRITSVVVTSAKAKISFGGNDDEAEAMSDVVMKRLVPVLVVKMLKRIEDTGVADLGGVTFTRDSIRVKKKSVRLADIVHIEAQAGFLHLWTDVKNKSALSFSLADNNGWVAAELVSALLGPPAAPAEAVEEPVAEPVSA